MYFELTGAPGSGKTYVANNFMDRARIPYPLTKPLANFVFEVFSLPIVIASVNPKILLYCFSSSVKADTRFFFKFNVFRNAVKKIAFFRLFGSAGHGLIRADEGVSHLPFLFGYSDEEEFIEFCEIFSHLLCKINLVHVKCDPDIMFSRLQVRGHKRVNSEDVEQLSAFVLKNARISSLMEVVMSTYVASYRVVDNN